MTVANAIEVLRGLPPEAIIVGWNAGSCRFDVQITDSYSYETMPEHRQIKRIIEASAEAFSTNEAEVLGEGRQVNVASARHMAVWMLRAIGLSYTQIAKALNRRCHGTPMESMKRARCFFETEKRWRDSAVYVARKSGITMNVERDWRNVK